MLSVLLEPLQGLVRVQVLDVEVAELLEFELARAICEWSEIEESVDLIMDGEELNVVTFSFSDKIIILLQLGMKSVTWSTSMPQKCTTYISLRAHKCNTHPCRTC